MSSRGGSVSRRGPRNIGQLGRRPANTVRNAGARAAGSGAHALARAGHFAGRAAGAGAHAAGRAGHYGGRAAHPAVRAGARAAGAGAHAAGRAGHYAGRAARPGINATRNVGRGVRNAAHLAGNAARGPAGMARPAANAAKNAVNRLRGANSKPEKPKSAAAEARRRAVNKGLEAGGKALGPYGMVAAKAIILVKDNKKVRELLLYGILLAAFLLVYFLAGGTSASHPPKSAIINPTNPLQVTVTCNPAQIPVGKTSVCTITVTDSQDTDDITVVATIYPFAQYKNNSASPQGTYDSKNKTVTWDTKKLKIQLSAPITQTFMLTVTKTQKIQAVPIVVTVNAAGGIGGGVACTGTGCAAAEAKWQQVLQLGKQYGQTWIGFLNDACIIAGQQDYPLAVIVGQGALESAHGTSNFAKTRNNFFGFDAYTNNPGAAKSYPDAAASILDYVNLIKKSYQQAYAARSDPVKMVELIKAGGYATDPNYVQEVTSIKEFQLLEGVKNPTCN